MRPFALILSACFLAGCQPEPAWTPDSLPPPPATPSCVPTPAASGQCSQRCGTYVTSFEQVKGDCGERAEQLAQLAGDPTQAPPPCRGVFSVSPDSCFSQFDVRCPTKDASGTTLASVERGALRWSTDSSQADGSLELWVLDSEDKLRCNSQYLVSVQRR